MLTFTLATCSVTVPVTMFPREELAKEYTNKLETLFEDMEKVEKNFRLDQQNFKVGIRFSISLLQASLEQDGEPVHVLDP